MPLIFFGDKRLNQVSEEADTHYIHSQECSELIKEMLAIHKASGAVGIAAPQLGVNKTIIVIGATENSSRKVNFDFPVQVLINPKIKPMAEEIVEGDEGCLSLPGVMASVPRYNSIDVSSLNTSGVLVNFQATGLKARVIQHEMDHLLGINFISLVKDFSTLKFVKESMQKICAL